MKRALALAFLSLAVACGKGSTNAGDGGDSGTGGSNGGSGGSWGCLNAGGSCVCQTNPPPGEYPDQACTGSYPCCYVTPPSSAQPESQCSCISAPSAQCAGIISGFPGSSQVSNCPPGATSGGSSTGSGGSSGTSGANAWGCANETDSCVCKLGASPADYPLTSCQAAACCYTATFRGTTQCFCSDQLPPDRCTAAVANSPGAVQVSVCPAPASTGGSGSTGTTATTSGTNSSASNGGSLGGSGGSNSSIGGSGGSAGTNASGGSSTGTNSSAGTNAGTNASGGSLGGSNGSAGSGGSNSGVGGSAGSSGGSNGSVGGSNGSAGGSTGSGGTNTSAGTNASGSGSGTSASSGTNSSAGTTGSTATSSGPIDYGAGSADVSGSQAQAFTPAGAFEEAGYDPAHGVPTQNFLIFDAPMTCFMFETHYFPKYYGHLPDGRLVYSDYPDAGALYYPNYQNVLYDRPDGGSRYYYLANGNIQDFSGSQPVTAFPKTAHVVLGIVDSTNSQPVQLGTYPAYNNNFLGVGYVALDSHVDAGIIDTIAGSGTVTFTSHTSSRLQGSFDVTLENLGLNGQADDDGGGIEFYPDGGISVPDGGLGAQLGAVDAGYLSGHFNAVQCSF